MRRSDIKALPSLEELQRLFAYNPETGVLIWRVRPHEKAFRIKMGMPAGTVGKKGYLVVGIGRSYFLVHRIIWKLQTGADPEDQVDHKDAVRTNNKWSNLRAADNGKNRCNTRIPKNNKSGVKGVSLRRGLWVAQIGIDRRVIRLGMFTEFEAAVAVRRKAEQILHGEFSREML